MTYLLIAFTVEVVVVGALALLLRSTRRAIDRGDVTTFTTARGSKRQMEQQTSSPKLPLAEIKRFTK